MFLAVLTLAAAVVAKVLPMNRPLELTINRDAQRDVCTRVTLRDVQVHKGLLPVHGSPGPAYVSDQSFFHISPTKTVERLRFYSYDRGFLLHQAESICGDEAGWLGSPTIPNDDDGTPTPTIELQMDTHQFLLHVSTSATPSPPLQITRLFGVGPSSNRVDLVFFSDGYTSDEYDKFIEDATRLAGDISGNQTFATVNPLLNFWAAFSPSTESGIGVGGEPKDTVYGLYRDGTELRGVYYSKPDVAHAACSSMGDRCDYPILLGNDPLYGGLGGEFTVVTSSLLNGALVLRHELGHSIIEVGEEYDGGTEYFGVNAAHSLSESSFPWSHWLSYGLADSNPRAERSVMPFQAYPWTMLNTSSPWSATFISSGTYARYVVRFSLSGLPTQADLRVELDGEDLHWTPRLDIGFDRWHYDINRNKSLEPGPHRLSFILLEHAHEGIAQLCSSEIIEYGRQSEFNDTQDYIGAFPTFSQTNETSYRPTNEACLMRVVTSPNFCSVCIEGLWLSLLKRVDLIDDVRIGCRHSDSSKWTRTFDLDLVPLAHLRPANRVAAESFEITWKKDGSVLTRFSNSTQVEIDDEDSVGKYTVDVIFHTDEVRIDKTGYLTSGGDVFVVERCSFHTLRF